MAESSLSMTYSDFREEIAFYLGYGRDSSNWTTAKSDSIDSVLKSGLRQFYNPPRLPGDATNHEWSFLKIVTTISIGPVDGTMSGVPVYDGSSTSTITATSGVFLEEMATEGVNITFDTSGNSYEITSYTSSTEIVVSGDASGETSGDGFTVEATENYALPDDFGAINGNLVYKDYTGYASIPIVPERTVRSMRNIEISGFPEIAAVRPKSSTGASGQRFELMLYPKPSSSYTLKYCYTPLMNTLSESYPYPYGGEQHSETIMASCLAVAEQRLYDRRGEKWQIFMERLQASVDFDRKAFSAEWIGVMGNVSRGDYLDGIYNSGLYDSGYDITVTVS